MVYCLSIWGSLLSNTQIAKLQAVQDSCIKLIDRRKTSKELGILSIVDLLDLEKLKFCYQYLQDALPRNVANCVGTDPHGNSLTKKHRYNTCNKSVPYRPKTNCSVYNRSLFYNYLTKYVTLTAAIKCTNNISQFVKQCKLWLTNK